MYELSLRGCIRERHRNGFGSSVMAVCGGGIGGSNSLLEYLDMYRIINLLNNIHSTLLHFISFEVFVRPRGKHK